MDYIILLLIVGFCVVWAVTREYLTILVSNSFRLLSPVDIEEMAGLRFSRNLLWMYFALMAAWAFSGVPGGQAPLYAQWGPFSRTVSCLLFFGLLLLWNATKYALLQLIAKVIEAPFFTRIMRRIGLNYSVLACVLFLPLYLGFSYVAPQAVGIMGLAAGVLFGLCYVIYLVRLGHFFLTAGFSLFFMFLYLCTLEIAPVLAFLKYTALIR